LINTNTADDIVCDGMKSTVTRNILIHVAVTITTHVDKLHTGVFVTRSGIYYITTTHMTQCTFTLTPLKSMFFGSRM